MEMQLDKEGVTKPSPQFPAMVFSSKRAASELTQMHFLLARCIGARRRTTSHAS